VELTVHIAVNPALVLQRPSSVELTAYIAGVNGAVESKGADCGRIVALPSPAFA
jgi:hypothetical protein